MLAGARRGLLCVYFCLLHANWRVAQFEIGTKSVEIRCVMPELRIIWVRSRSIWQRYELWFWYILPFGCFRSCSFRLNHGILRDFRPYNTKRQLGRCGFTIRIQIYHGWLFFRSRSSRLCCVFIIWGCRHRCVLFRRFRQHIKKYLR